MQRSCFEFICMQRSACTTPASSLPHKSTIFRKFPIVWRIRRNYSCRHGAGDNFAAIPDELTTNLAHGT